MQIITGIDNEAADELRDCLKFAKQHLEAAWKIAEQVDAERKEEKELVDHTAEACDQTSNAISALESRWKHWEDCAAESAAGY